MKTSMILGILLMLVSVDTASARKMMTDRERARQQAEHDCYDDVQKLCNADIPNETKIEACMKVHHSQLSPACRKVFDAGLK